MSNISDNEPASKAIPQQPDSDLTGDAEGHRFHRTRDGGGAGEGDTEGHLAVLPRGLGAIEDAGTSSYGTTSFGDDLDDTEGHRAGW
jgi:hypothetical protein